MRSRRWDDGGDVTCAQVLYKNGPDRGGWEGVVSQGGTSLGTPQGQRCPDQQRTRIC